MRLFTALFCLAFGSPLPAQDWATRELCFSEPLSVTAEDVAPLDLSKLETEGDIVPNGVGKYWEVSRPNGATSYMWGTMHVSLPSVLDLPQTVVDRISSARSLALEYDATFPDRASIEASYEAPGRFRDGGDPFLPAQPLDLDYLGDKVATWVLRRLEETGFGEDALYAYTYAGLAEFLLTDPCSDFSAGVIPIQDHLIHTLAHIAGAKIVSLEHPDDFIRDLAEDERIAKSVVATYASYLEPVERIRNYNAGATIYSEGRLGFWAAWDRAHMVNTYGPRGQQFVETTDGYMLTERNKRFVKALLPELEQGNTFIAVGAAHLPGTTGLVALLRNEGFDVMRIPVSGEVQ